MKALLFSILLIICLNPVDAGRGCCSHHGGVCGCACCDGTPLSAKCASNSDCGQSNNKETSGKGNSSGKYSQTESNSASSEVSDEVVLFNTNSLKYHCPSCQWAIKCTRNCISVSLEKAKSSGGIPCKVCGGSCK
jgi:hypothetical protein